MTKIDISTLSRPYNVTIDTKWCIGYSYGEDDTEQVSPLERYVFKVEYCGVKPVLEFYKYDSFHEMGTFTPYADGEKTDIEMIQYDADEFYFLTEDEFFLEEI